jgi:hypothetical protein
MSLSTSTVASLIPEARELVLPDGIVATSFPSIKATLAELSVSFDSWQNGLGRCIHSLGADGDFAADVVAMSIARQVGKTYMVGGLQFADCIKTPDTTVVWTAHRFKVARETFMELKGLAESPALLPYVDPDEIKTAAGNETIPFRNGSRILFAARERGSIRGVAKVRKLVLDEAQILTDTAMSDLTPTMNRAVNPQIIMMGTPPKPTDPGTVFTEIRREALTGESEGTLYFELSADPDADLDDWAQIKKANPSLDVHTPRKAIRRLRRVLADDDFRREAMGIWDSIDGTMVIDALTWRSVADPTAEALGEVAYGIDVSPDREHASIGMSGNTAGGRLLVEHVEGRNSADWVVGVAKRIYVAQRPRCFVIDAQSPASRFAPELIEAEIPVVITGAREYANSCAAFYDSAMGRNDVQLVHLDQPSLNVALTKASKRDIGAEGLWAWNRKKADSDITPLVAVSLAIHGLSAPLGDIKGGPQTRAQFFAF